MMEKTFQQTYTHPITHNSTTYCKIGAFQVNLMGWVQQELGVSTWATCGWENV